MSNLIAFEHSVRVVSDLMVKTNQQFWVFTAEDIEQYNDIKEHLGLRSSTASDFVAVVKGATKGDGDDMAAFMYILGIIYNHMGFNEYSSQASIYWYAYLVFVPDHIRRFGHEPLHIDKVIEYAFENGVFPSEEF